MMDPGGKKPKNEKDKKIKNLFYCKILNNYLFSNYFFTESYSFLKMLLNRFYRLDLWIRSIGNSIRTWIRIRITTCMRIRNTEPLSTIYARVMACALIFLAELPDIINCLSLL